MLWLPVLVIFTLALEGAFHTEYNPYLESLRNRPWKSFQSYVQVRPGAFLFYWLYYADGTTDGAYRKPLVIWVQGGPGLAATGIGNFAEFGPLDMEMQPRNHTWVNGRNVLLIDHPVGTGFSYATNDSLLVKTDREMGNRKETSQNELQRHRHRKRMGVAKGKYLGPTGFLVPYGCHRPEHVFTRQRHCEGHEEGEMDINMNNINQVSPYPALDKLAVKVNKYVKPMLSHVVNQNLQWSYHSEKVFTTLYKNFFVPSTKFLEMLLNSTKLKIAVYNGNLDVVTPLAGASNWVHKLEWPGAQELKEAKRQPIRGFRNGFFKQSRQLSFWSVFGAGHWIPEDNPMAMEHILEHMLEASN
ncbi:uncharacterized protein LOC134805779 isoform X2 [Cydia splendana]|uniref:uncharacterized protein LOC134805779 isoform X2 n=1 Tax=Cydia splendana TaxID=1100963 RepID=UPI00300D23DB